MSSWLCLYKPMNYERYVRKRNLFIQASIYFKSPVLILLMLLTVDH